MFCHKGEFHPFQEYSISGGGTVISDFWTFNGDAWKDVDAFGGASTYTDVSGPGDEAWSRDGSVARIVGDFAVAAGGCTLSSAKVYVVVGGPFPPQSAGEAAGSHNSRC